MVIFLNGTSSSGKTSVARALIEQLPEPYFYFSIDQFLGPALPPKINMEVPEDLRIVDRSISAFNQALGVYSQSIDFMIVDHVLQKPQWLKEAAESLAGADVFFVKITAPISVIEERERNRGDRKPGTARAQIQMIDSYQYDLVIDTSIKSAADGAAEIIANLKPGNGLTKAAKLLL